MPKGVAMGSVRHAGDTRMEPYIDQKGQGILTPQAGEVKVMFYVPVPYTGVCLDLFLH